MACALLSATRTVFAAPAASDDVVELPQISVSAARPDLAQASQDTAQVPGGASVIDADALRDGRLNSPADLFALQPGVLVMTAFGGIDHPRISIRGAGIQRAGDPGAGRGILFLQDGFPVNYSDGSYDFIDFLDPAGLDHAKILRGGNAILLGATTLGGAVALSSPTPRDMPGGLLRGEAGGHGYLRGQLAFSGVTAGSASGADFHFDFTGFTLDGWRDHDHQEAARARLNIGAQLGNGWSNRLFLSAMRSRVEITGAQTLAQIAARDTSALPFALIAQLGRDTSQYRLGDRVAGPLAGGTLSAGAGIAYVDFTHTAGSITRSRNTDASLDATWTRPARLLPASADLAAAITLGARAQLGRRAQQLFPNNGGVPGPLNASNRLTAENGTLWIDGQLAPGGGFTLIATASFTRANRINENLFSAGANNSKSAAAAAFLPRLALRYERGALQCFANVTRSFEPLTWDAVLATPPNATLSPQNAITTEAGLRARARRLALELTAYRSWVRDELLLLATNAAGDATRFGNAGRTIHQGIEAAADINLLRTAAHTLAARASYTLTDCHFTNDPVWRDNTLPVNPPHFAQLALRYHHARAWFGGATLTWQPRGGWADYANTLRAPGYVTLDLRAAYAPAKGLGIFLDLRNALDRRYVSGINAGSGNLHARDNTSFFPGEPRALYAGAELRW